MSVDREHLTERLIELVDQIGRRARAANPVDWPDVELTMPQLRTLAILAVGPARMSDIASQLGSSLPATTSMIDRLVEKGLVERAHDTEDRRVVVTRLTPAGREILDDFWRVQQESLREMADVLSDGELAIVVQAMEVLAAAGERRNSSGSASKGAS